MPDALMQAVLMTFAALSATPAYFPGPREWLATATQELKDALWLGDPQAIERALEGADFAMQAASEHEAEGAWLKSSEQSGWEEAYLEDQRDRDFANYFR